MDIVNCIVCDAVKSNRTLAKKDYLLMSMEVGEGNALDNSKQ